MSLADGKVDVSGDSPLASSAEPEACVGFVPATGVACPLLCSVLGLALIFGEKNIHALFEKAGCGKNVQENVEAFGAVARFFD